jgi:uncharacterized protein (TIGR02145 family)
MKKLNKVSGILLVLLFIHGETSFAFLSPIVGTWTIINTTQTGCKDPKSNSANPCKNSETTKCWVIKFTADSKYTFENAPGATAPETGTYSIKGNIISTTSSTGVKGTTAFTITGDLFTMTVLEPSTGCTISFIFSKQSSGQINVATTQTEVSSVKIGSQTWMSKDLDVSAFANGDPIPQAKTTEEWKNALDKQTPAWCYFDYDPANGAKYGKLYNWYSVNDPRGLAPNGWHVPSDVEWNVLAEQVGGVDKAGVTLKNASGWDDNGNGTNSSGFAGLPGGGLQTSTGNVISFFGIRQTGNWWTSTGFNDVYAWTRILQRNNDALLRAVGKKNFGISVRCLKD